MQNITDRRRIRSDFAELHVFALINFLLHQFMLKIATDDLVLAECKPIMPNRNIGDVYMTGMDSDLVC